jgi:tetratricopeptide (TPR) repeat protein
MTTRRTLLAGGLAAVLCGGAPARASFSGAKALYDAGDWVAAEQLAASASDSASKTLAAQAVLAQLMIGALADESRDVKRALARRAQAHARAALDIDPDYAPAHLRLAAGLGYEARYRSVLSAAMARLPQRGLTHIETALALDPSDPWAHALLGAWNLEVARKGGEGVFGSDIEAGLDAYRTAVSMEEAEPAIPYHFALALIAADPVQRRDEAAAMLDQALSDPAEGAFSQAAQSLARSLKAELDANPATAQTLAITRLEQ